MPERISASGMFGVRTSASGRSFSHSAVTASSRNSFAPDVATMTGSTTMCFAPYSFNFAAIVSISSAEDTMPILTASGKMSVNTASSCSARKCGVESKMSVTPVVFWAVRAVTAHRAKNAVGGHGLDVCLDTGASAGITSGNGQCCSHGDNFLSFLYTARFYKAVQGGAPGVPLGDAFFYSNTASCKSLTYRSAAICSPAWSVSPSAS